MSSTPDIGSRRIGKFFMIDRAVYSKDAAEIFAQLRFVPLRVEHLAYKDHFEFIGYSYQFDITEFGELVPEYNVEITKENETIQVRALRL
jgi:hypothetical protein